MSIAARRTAYADPVEQGRLGREVEKALYSLADLTDRMGGGVVEEDVDHHVHAVARFAAAQLSCLRDRREGTGSLCAAVERELALAESTIAALHSIARMWKDEDEGLPFPVLDQEWETVMPRMPRSECFPSMIRLSKFIRQRFRGDTGERWKEMARAAGRGEPPQNRRILL